MSRKAITAVALLFTCGVVVAVVRGQDNSGSYSNNERGASGGEERKEHSVLVRRQPLQQVSEEPVLRTATRTSPSRGGNGYANRLQQVRESASRPGGRLIPSQAPGTSAPASVPAQLDAAPANPQSIDLSPPPTQPSATTSSRRVGPSQATTAPPAASEILPTQQVPAPEFSDPPIQTSVGEPPVEPAAPQSLTPQTSVERQPVERQPIERQAIERQAIERQSADRQPADLEQGSLDQGYATAVDDQIRMSTSGPALRIDTVGPRSIMIGKEATYSVTLSNVGNQSAKDVFVRMELPEWVNVVSQEASVGTAQPQEDDGTGQRLIWNVTQLAARGQETVQLKVIPMKNRNFGLAIDWTVRPESSLAQIEVQQPQLELSVFGPKDILYGETAVYTIQLTNPGTGDATDVAIDFSYGAQNLPTKRVGTLAAGAQTEISVELTSRQAGKLPVSAVATGGEGLRASAAEEVLVRRAQLELSVAGSQRKFAGGVGTYEVRVRNTGNATATDVLAKVLLPSGSKFIAGSELTPANQGFVKRVGPLAPNAERVFTVQCQLTQPGDNRVEVHAEAESELAASGSFVTRVDALADLKLQVNDPQGPTAVGTKASYEIVVENRGSKAAEDVKVVAQFSEGIEPIRAQGSVAEIVPGQVLFQTIPRIGPGEKVKMTIIAVAEKAGNHRFRVETTTTEPETRLVAEESTHFFGAELVGSQR